MSVIIAGDPTTTNDVEPQHALGTTRWARFNGLPAKFRYVKIVDIDVTEGDSVEYASTTTYDVTADRAGGSSLGRFPAGVAVGSITAGRYGWVMIEGIHDNVKTDGGVTADDLLITHATADGQFDTGTLGTNDAIAIGFALTTDDASTPSRCAARICVKL